MAGSFYPGNAKSLEDTLDQLFAKIDNKTHGTHVQALIVPHAGYSFSGFVAASGYGQIDKNNFCQNIFILASSHHINIGKASVYNQGNYLTPLGEVPVNLEIANKLIEENNCFTYNVGAHAREHSIEVQLPFIQYHFENSIPIIPIVLGTQDPGICKEIAGALAPYFTEENLFIISSDFSHYPDYKSANKVDSITANALCSGDPIQFLSTIETNSKLNIPGLVTSMCAWPAGLTLLYLAENSSDLQFNQIIYKNSGDARINKDKTSVVGYHAITLTREKKNESFGLTAKDKKQLLEISRDTLTSYIPGRKKIKLEKEEFSPELKSILGAFVSLKKNGQLRGCIGTFKPDAGLYSQVQSLTIASATKDTRFLPVQQKELEEIDIEISVLTPMKKIEDISEIVLGKHGIYMKKNGRSGTLLPQVASETGWSLEEFLGHCARDKAGIVWNEWKDAEIFIYEAIVFGEKDNLNYKK